MPSPLSRPTALDAALVAVYAAALWFLAPRLLPQLLLVGVLLALALRWVTRSRSFVASFAWFRRYPFKGAFVILASVAVALLPLVASLVVGATAAPRINFGELAGSLPVGFLWFWLFYAIGTRLQERRDERLIRNYEAKRSREAE
jgi:hypothetical protein